LLRSIGLPKAELSVLFLGDCAMRTLNRQYRGKDTTTDVLSFSLREGSFPSIQPDMLGDIVISVPRAARQARESGHSLACEIEHLLVHGLVHLLGYDHERGPRDACKMKRMERRLLGEYSREA
jgi:probable rRNA maturation factor